MRTNAEILYDVAMRLHGAPYRWGGDDPMAGFDCSGLVIELLQSCGVLPKGIDMTAQGLFQYPVFQPVSFATLGALAFFGASKSQVTHVGFCLNDQLMLEAGSGGSSTVDLATAIKQNAYVRVRPIKSRKDFVGFRLAAV